MPSNQSQFMQRHNDAVPVSEAEVTNQSENAVESDTAASAKGSTRWLIYLFGLAAATVFIFVAPAPYSIVLLVALICISLLVAAWDAELSISSIAHDVSQFVATVQQMRTSVNSPATGLVIKTSHWSRGLALLALVLMVVSAIGFRASPEETPLDGAVFFMVLGALALGGSILLSPREALLDTPTENALSPSRSRWKPIAFGVLLLLILAEFNGRALGLPLFAHQISHHIAFALLVVGIGSIVWGLSGAPRLSINRDSLMTLPWNEIVPILAIFVLALVLRTWELGSAIRQQIDEGVVVEGYFHALGNQDAGLVTQVSGRLSATQLFPYWQTILVSIFGRTFEGLRMTNAVVGSLTVLAIYLLAQALFDRKTALIAALVMATFPPHVHFSRVAMAHIADPLAGTLALAFLARGLKHNRRVDWALAGISLGFTQYFFEGGRLLFPPLFITAVALMVIGLRGHLRAHWRGLVIAVLTFLFTIMPIYYTIFALNAPRATRMEDSGLTAEYFKGILQEGISGAEVNELVSRFTFPFQLYVHQPEIALFYGGDQPMILFYIVPFFLLGVFYIVWRGRVPAWMIVLWIIAAGLGNALMRDMAVYARFVVVFPPLALLIAVGIRYGVSLLIPKQVQIATAAMVVVTVAVGIAQVNYYFTEHIPLHDRQLRDSTAYDGMDALLRAAALPDAKETQIYMVTEPAYDATILQIFSTFFIDGLEYQLHTMPPSEFTNDFIAALPHDHDYAFFFAPDDTATVERLSEFFTLDAPVETAYDIPPEKALVLYYARHQEQG